MQEYDLLDVKAENHSLTGIERDRLDAILRELNNYWVIEETKAKQRARDRDIVEVIGTQHISMRWLTKEEGKNKLMV
jgi:hypothetical protein